MTGFSSRHSNGKEVDCPLFLEILRSSKSRRLVEFVVGKSLKMTQCSSGPISSPVAPMSRRGTPLRMRRAMRMIMEYWRIHPGCLL